MKAVDTNILVRFLIGDDEFQAEKAYTIFKKAESDKKVLLLLLIKKTLISNYPNSQSEIVCLLFLIISGYGWLVETSDTKGQQDAD